MILSKMLLRPICIAIFQISLLFIYFEGMVRRDNDEHFPGLNELIAVIGFSIQAQEHHPIMTAVDQRGEQTINRNAKTLGKLNLFF